MGKITNKELISIIIPVYNVEKYVEKCIESVINQTYKRIEIILVDDGSIDRSGAICDDFCKKDSRIKVIHKANGGLSDARNAGIDIAQGEYITFIDSDDYVINTYISFLHKLIKSNKADIAIGKHYIRFPNSIVNTGSGKFYKLNSKKALEMCLYGDDFDVSAWAKMYKADLFKDIRYPVNRIFEDSAIIYKLIDRAQRIVFHSVPIYYYVIREDSIITSKFDRKKLDLITSTKEMANYTISKYPDLKNAANRRVMYAYLSTLTKLIKVDKKRRNTEYYEDLEEIEKYIKENRKNILKDKNIPKMDRYALKIIKYGVGAFSTCWKLYEKFGKQKERGIINI